MGEFHKLMKETTETTMAMKMRLPIFSYCTSCSPWIYNLNSDRNYGGTHHEHPRLNDMYEYKTITVAPPPNGAALPSTFGRERSGGKNPKRKYYIIIDRTD